MRPRDIHVGEICRIRLVAVIIALHEWSSRGGDHRLEESIGRNKIGLKIELIEECAEEAELEHFVSSG